MVAATDLAERVGLCTPGLCMKVVGLLRQIGLPTHAANLASTDTLIDAMRLDKKVESGKIRLVLPRKMADIVVTSEVPVTEIAAAWDRLRVER
jgi:3-dehydroquinate synthase